MYRFGSSILLAAAIALTTAGAAAAQGQTKTLPYDHIHLNVPDAAVASEFYEKIFGGRRITEAPNRIMFGSTRLMFLISKTPAPPSQGSVIDHIGFSVADVEATLKQIEAAGGKVEGPPRDVPGLFKLAFAVDPWGTRLEVVNDPELMGLHHLHLVAPDPNATFTWLGEKLGGERARLKNRIEGMKYSADGFSTVWILVNKGEGVPSQGRAIDHIGWRSTGLNADIETLRGKGATIQTEPRALKLPAGPPINFAYVMGPHGERVELVERPGLKPGE